MRDVLINGIKEIANFSDEDIKLFMESLDESYVAKGEYFLREGKISHQIGYITDGLMMHFKIVDGVEIPADFTKENEWIAYLKSFTGSIPSDMNIKALENTYLLTLSNLKMSELFQKQPKFMALKSYYTEQSFIKNTEHTANLATLDAKQRYYKFMEEHTELLNRIPQYYIAAYLGIKPQSLSRLRK